MNPTRLARVRLNLVAPPWLCDASKAPAPVRPSSCPPRASPRRACIVRARSRVSGNAVHVLGRRGRVMRSDRRLHSEPINFEQPCASCAPDAETVPICTGGPLSSRGLRLVLTPRGVQTRDSLPSEDGRAFIEGLGARRWERDRGNARFTTRRPLGEPSEIAWGLFVLPRARCECTLDVPVASPGARGDRSPIVRVLRGPPRPFPRASS